MAERQDATTIRLQIRFADQAGALGRIAGLFERRRIELRSFVLAGPTPDVRFFRLRVHARGAPAELQRVRLALEKLVAVAEVREASHGGAESDFQFQL